MTRSACLLKMLEMSLRQYENLYQLYVYERMNTRYGGRTIAFYVLTKCFLRKTQLYYYMVCTSIAR
jgi:hypothetical protein